MTVGYFVDPDGKTYYDGPVDKIKKINPRAVQVSQPMPDNVSRYNFQDKRWEKSMDKMRTAWTPLRNEMLRKTYWLITQDSPLNEGQKTQLSNYRSELINLFNQPAASARFPELPGFAKEWVE